LASTAAAVNISHEETDRTGKPGFASPRHDDSTTVADQSIGFQRKSHASFS
jgi:hypothetical protein